MNVEEILAEHPSLTKEQIVKYETIAADRPAAMQSACPALVWVRDVGNIAIMRSNAYIDLRVDHVRNGEWKGAVFIAMKPNDTVEIRQNLDGRNYDAFSC